jgi:hypothetical protein
VSEPAARAIQLLWRAESEIALIDRTRPLALANELSRLIAAWLSGSGASPTLQYAPAPRLLPLQRALGAIIENAPHLGDEGTWLGGRAAELLLESQIVQAVGEKAFCSLASTRFPPPRGAAAQNLEVLARSWIAQGAASSANEARFISDDRREPRSLVSVISRRLGALNLPASVRVDSCLMSVAACTGRSIVVRSGARLTERDGLRIAEHEIVGHLLPRLSARTRRDVLCCGCAGATDDEEGRALLIEQRLVLMEPSRRAELGARHLACTFLRRGATFVDSVRGLIELGSPVDIAVRVTLRAARGGGLGREIIYLPAMQRLQQAFDATPALEDWFRLGRASLAYAVSRVSSTTRGNGRRVLSSSAETARKPN